MYGLVKHLLGLVRAAQLQIKFADGQLAFHIQGRKLVQSFQACQPFGRIAGFRVNFRQLAQRLKKHGGSAAGVFISFAGLVILLHGAEDIADEQQGRR